MSIPAPRFHGEYMQILMIVDMYSSRVVNERSNKEMRRFFFLSFRLEMTSKQDFFWIYDYNKSNN